MGRFSSRARAKQAVRASHPSKVWFWCLTFHFFWPFLAQKQKFMELMMKMCWGEGFGALNCSCVRSWCFWIFVLRRWLRDLIALCLIETSRELVTTLAVVFLTARGSGADLRMELIIDWVFCIYSLNSEISQACLCSQANCHSRLSRSTGRKWESILIDMDSRCRSTSFSPRE